MDIFTYGDYTVDVLNTSDAINLKPTHLPKNDMLQRNMSHTHKCSIDIMDYNPYNDQYTYEDCVEYNEGVQQIIKRLVKVDTED